MVAEVESFLEAGVINFLPDVTVGEDRRFEIGVADFLPVLTEGEDNVETGVVDFLPDGDKDRRLLAPTSGDKDFLPDVTEGDEECLLVNDDLPPFVLTGEEDCFLLLTGDDFLLDDFSFLKLSARTDLPGVTNVDESDIDTDDLSNATTAEVSFLDFGDPLDTDAIDFLISEFTGETLFLLGTVAGVDIFFLVDAFIGDVNNSAIPDIFRVSSNLGDAATFEFLLDVETSVLFSISDTEKLNW